MMLRFLAATAGKYAMNNELYRVPMYPEKNRIFKCGQTDWWTGNWAEKQAQPWIYSIFSFRQFILQTYKFTFLYCFVYICTTDTSIKHLCQSRRRLSSMPSSIFKFYTNLIIKNYKVFSSIPVVAQLEWQPWIFIWEL